MWCHRSNPNGSCFVSANGCPNPTMSGQAFSHATGGEPRIYSNTLQQCLQDCVDEPECTSVDWK